MRLSPTMRANLERLAGPGSISIRWINVSREAVQEDGWFYLPVAQGEALLARGLVECRLYGRTTYYRLTAAGRAEVV